MKDKGFGRTATHSTTTMESTRGHHGMSGIA
jgi:hypothetical protein